MSIRSGLTASLVLLASCNAIAGEPAGDWLRIKSIGSQDKPFPTVWIAPASLALEDDNELNDIIVLGTSSYLAARKLARSLECPATVQSPELSNFATLEVVESVRGAPRVICVLQSADACVYLRPFATRRDYQDWTEMNAAVANLRLRLGCKS